MFIADCLGPFDTIIKPINLIQASESITEDMPIETRTNHGGLSCTLAIHHMINAIGTASSMVAMNSLMTLPLDVDKLDAVDGVAHLDFVVPGVECHELSTRPARETFLLAVCGAHSR